MSRTALLASVHIAKKELHFDDATYRAVLKRAVNKHSAGDCTDAQLRSLLDEFKRLGWHKAHSKKPLSAKPKVRMIYAIWSDIRPLLDGATGDAELRAFVRRQTGVSAPEFLDDAHANKVIEGLKGWLARLKEGAAA